MRTLLLAVVVLWAPAVAAQICPGLTGDAALSCVASNYTPSTVLSDAASKDRLYDTVDVTSQGGVSGVVGLYSGYFVPFDGSPNSDPSQDVFNNGSGINQEHVFPRSRGTDGNNAERDMHHLYPTRVKVNSDRGSLPFGSIPDGASSTWYQNDSEVRTTPSNPDLWSQLAGGEFEPRASARGDVARAMFYVAAVYKSRVDISWFEGQLDVLLEWHAADPPSGADRSRSERVAGFQSGCGAGSCINPFVHDASLAERAFGDGGGSNSAPTAVDDEASTDAGQAVTINVLTNDSDVDNDDLEVDLVDDPANGTASTNGTTVTYTPDAGFTGDDSFDYRITDGTLTASATITVTVRSGTMAPSAADDEATTDEDEEVTISVLANDSDPAGLTVTAVGPASNGSTSTNGTTVTYEPDADFEGQDSFTYTASNAQGTAQGTVTVTVRAVNDAPSAPSLVSPSDGATVDTRTGGVAIVSWSAAGDVDGDAVTYRWELAEDASFASILLSVETAATTIEVALSDLAEALDDVPDASTEVAHRTVALDGTAETAGPSRDLTVLLDRSTSDEDVPVAFAIGAARPNPTAGAISILADLTTAGPVQIEAYDALGRRVAAAEVRLGSGANQRLAVDLSGVPAGVYVVRVVAGTDVATRTVVVVR